MSETFVENFARLSPLERSQKLVWNEDAFWIDPNQLMNPVIECAQERFCAGCRSRLPAYWGGEQVQDDTARRMLIQYVCQSCDDFALCGLCGSDDACTSPGHEMATVDLRWLVEGIDTRTPQEQSRSLLIAAAGLLQLKQAFCVTCLDVNPGESPAKDTQSRERVRDIWSMYFKAYIYDLFLSSQRQCPTCDMVWRSIALCLPEEIFHENVRLMLEIGDHSLGLTFFGDFSGLWMLGQSASSQRSQLGWPKLEVARNYNKHPGSEISFNIIRDWLSTCEGAHKHPRCAQSPEARLPRRVIELSTTEDDEVPSLRLRERCGIRAKYIALSHRWGNSNPKTTTNNLLQMRTGFAFENLPKTYRDAITCAQKLGVQHVWIDSLCIVQDDAKDWDEESAKMGDIYGNAFLVIDAASAEGDERGFLKERSQEFIGYQVNILGIKGAEEIIVQKKMPHDFFDKETPFKQWGVGVRSVSVVRRSATSSRAWCMQEVSLSRRTLSFYNSEMVWECHSQMACECGKLSEIPPETDVDEEIASSYSSATPEDQVEYNYAVAAVYPEPVLLSTLFLPSCDCEYTLKPFAILGTPKSVFQEWRLMTIPLYTLRNLTVPTDRLPALSAMAQVVANQTKSDVQVTPNYLAGIWRDDIQLGLLWSVVNKKASILRAEPMPSAYLGPSFSWVSVNKLVTYCMTGPVDVAGLPRDFIRCFGTVKIELTEACVELLGRNPFGRVKYAHIRIHGLSTVVGLFSNGQEYSIYHGNKHASFRPDTRLQHVKMQFKGETYSTVNRSRELVTEDWKEKLKCVLVADSHYQQKADSERLHNVAMLVLGQIVTEKGDLAYQRLGLAITKMEPNESQGWLDGLKTEEFLIV